MENHLFELYRTEGAALAKALRAIRPKPKLSLPLLIDPIVGDYLRSSTRWIAGGQETYGWGERNLQSPVGNWVTASLKRYRDFQLARNYASPFWAANYEICDVSGADRNHPNFLWTNILKFDEDRHRPSEQLEQIAFELFDVLPREVQILAPDAVIFFVGPRCEVRLNQVFPGIKYKLLPDFKTELLYFCEHPGLPPNSFWTYHPKRLRLTGNWAVIKKLGQLIGAMRKNGSGLAR